MSVSVALALGVLQGLTEFLPVSSSGHLALAQMVIPGFAQPGVLFDAVLHLGTALAVVWFERTAILDWLGSAEGRRLLALLALATLGTAASGFALRGAAEHAFVQPLLIGVGLVVTGLVVAGTRWLAGGEVDERRTGWGRAAVLGVVQGLAVFPGVSRSGLTITAGLGLGLERTWAARFSFLLSVPAILGVTAFELLSERHELVLAGPGLWWACVVGGVAAALSGLVALRVVIRTLGSRVFHRFSWYCLPLGVVVILLGAGVL